MFDSKKKLYEKISEIAIKDTIREFISDANAGLCTKNEILDECQFVEAKTENLNSKMAEIESVLCRWTCMKENDAHEELCALEEKYGSEEQVGKYYKEVEIERDQWEELLKKLKELMTEYKNFNKVLCFSNIRELLRQNPDVKIGQIEKEAGVRLGYMSRLEKTGNTSEPSIEFIVSAAKLLKVSVDTLISINLTGLTPTEQYLVKFFDKLKADTLKDKLNWNRETAINLNKIEADWNGYVAHPLFSEETFSKEPNCECSEEVVFNSKSFGPYTYIAGDCFNLRLKNGTTLYLMDIEKSIHKTNDTSIFAKEAWMAVPGKDKQLLVASKDNTPVAPILEVLFDTVKERMEHPKVNNDVMYAIDAFMKDDENDDLPF